MKKYGVGTLEHTGKRELIGHILELYDLLPDDKKKKKSKVLK